MKTIARQSSRGFFWHGVFIILPVLVLAMVGFISLRQDRLLAEGEARQAAQRHADEICRAFESAVTSREGAGSNYLAFRLSAQGLLVYPPTPPALPVPQPLELGTLSEEQVNSWTTANAPATDPNARAEAIRACDKLLEESLPGSIPGRVLYRLALLLNVEGKQADALRALRQIETQHPGASTGSGIPLLSLAQLKRFEWSNTNDAGDASALLLTTICSNLVNRPSFMTPFLLRNAGELARDRGLIKVVGAWQSEWNKHEKLRELAAAALANPIERRSKAATLPSVPVVPALFWIEPTNTSGAISRNDIDAKDSDEREPGLTAPWLAARVGDGQGGYWIVCRLVENAGGEPTCGTSGPFWSHLSTRVTPIPNWFAFTVQAAGRSLTFGPTGSPAVQPTVANTLATSHAVEVGADSLRVNAHLVDPQSLYARQAARSRWFGLLIGTAAIVALAGFISARRAFQRQQQLAEMKSNFVSSVSHELRAPIASVRLMAESLDRGTLRDPAKQRDYYKFIVQECRRLGALIENVLDFARIEQGRKEYDPQPTDVAALLQQSVKLLEPAAAEKQVKLVTIIPESPSTPETAPMLDGHAIQQALVNLIDNAVKHSPTGGTVTVGINGHRNGSVKSGTPEVLQMFVEDRGPGIPAQDREKIFERFHRRGTELRRNTQGVGIGLSIVKHIVEAHGGRVIVEGAIGQGSRFTIELPTKQVANAEG